MSERIHVVEAFRAYCEGDIDDTVVAATTELAYEAAAQMRARVTAFEWLPDEPLDYEKPELVARWLAAEDSSTLTYIVTITLVPFLSKSRQGGGS